VFSVIRPYPYFPNKKKNERPKESEKLKSKKGGKEKKYITNEWMASGQMERIGLSEVGNKYLGGQMPPI
jgi:hypothetical protein